MFVCVAVEKVTPSTRYFLPESAYLLRLVPVTINVRAVKEEGSMDVEAFVLALLYRPNIASFIFEDRIAFARSNQSC